MWTNSSLHHEQDTGCTMASSTSGEPMVVTSSNKHLPSKQHRVNSVFPLAEILQRQNDSIYPPAVTRYPILYHCYKGCTLGTLSIYEHLENVIQIIELFTALPLLFVGTTTTRSSVTKLR